MQPRRLILWIALALEAVFLTGTLGYLFSPISIGDPWFMTVNIPRVLAERLGDRSFVAIACFIAAAAAIILAGKIKPLLGGRAGWALAGLTLMAIAPFLRPIVWCAVVFLLTAGMGRFLLRAAGILKGMGGAEAPVVFFAIGMIVLVVEIFAISQFSLLSAGPIAGVMLVKAALTRRDLAALFDHMARRARAWRDELNDRGDQLLALLLIIFCGVSFACAVLPPSLYDEISYHMAFPKIYAQMHRVVFFPRLELSSDGSFSMVHFAGVLATNPETIFSYLYALSGPACVHIFQAMSLVLVCLAVIEIAAARGRFRAGLIGAVLIASIPLQNTMAATAHVEINLAVMVVATVGCHLEYLRERRFAWLIAAGPIAGLAIGSKLSMLILPGLIGASLVVQAAFTPGERRRIATHAAGFAAIALLTCAPWFWRAYQITGTPFYPVGTQFIVNKALSLTGLAPRTVIASQRGERGSLAASVSKPVMYPWNITFRGNQSGYYQSPEGAMGFALFILLPLVLLFPLRPGRHWAYLALTCALIMLCIPSLDRVRYALPFFPPLCLAAGLSADAALGSLGRRGRAAALIAICGIVALNLLYVPTSWDFRSIPLAEFRKPRTEAEYYLGSAVWKNKYEVAQCANKYLRSPEDRVVEVGWSLVCPYFCKGLWYSFSDKVNAEFFSRLYAARKGDGKAADAFADYLREKKVKLLVVRNDDLAGSGKDQSLRDEIVLLENFTYRIPGLDFIQSSPRFRVLDSIHDYSIVKVLGSARITAFGPESIEAGSGRAPDGSLAMWFRVEPAAGAFSAVFDGKPLASVRSGNVVTATVPRELIDKPGRHSIHLENSVTDDQTPPVTFIVR